MIGQEAEDVLHSFVGGDPRSQVLTHQRHQASPRRHRRRLVSAALVGVDDDHARSRLPYVRQVLPRNAGHVDTRL